LLRGTSDHPVGKIADRSVHREGLPQLLEASSRQPIVPILHSKCWKHRRLTWKCSLHSHSEVANSTMANLATWMRPKDEKWFRPFFAKHPEIHVFDARTRHVLMDQMDGLLLTGGSDITPEFLRQENIDPNLIDKDDIDPKRDRWEVDAISNAIKRGLPILAICRGIQVLNVALGGTLKLDIPGHRLPEQKEQDIQPLRHDRNANHRFENVNSSHHQAIDRLADGFEVEAWCADDDIIEQVRLRNYPFALAVQYHPERGKIYDALFENFFHRVKSFRAASKNSYYSPR
jgi:putative glutamine amidotransferase